MNVIDLLASELLLIWSRIKDLLGLVMASGTMSPPKRDEKMKGFELWLTEVKAWKVVGLKDVHGLQLALHLPEGSEIGCQILILLTQMI